jgi:hypothetical protein
MSLKTYLTIDKPILAESAVAWWDDGEKQGYSGTLDQLALMADGAIALMDWKTSYKIKPDYQLADYKKQLGAYSLAAEQMYGIDIEQAYCVISVYDPEEPKREAELQILQMEDEQALNKGSFATKSCHQLLLAQREAGAGILYAPTVAYFAGTRFCTTPILVPKLLLAP